MNKVNSTHCTDPRRSRATKYPKCAPLAAAALLLGVLLLPGLALAQPEQDTTRRERARAFLVLRIADALKLDEPEALKVSSIMRQSDERRRTLQQERQGIEQRLREALARQPADAGQLSKLLSDGNAIDQKLALVPEESFKELQKMLSVERQAKLFLFRRQLQGEIRRALQGRRGAGRGAGAGGPAPEPPGSGE